MSTNINYQLYIFDFDKTIINCDCTHTGYYNIEGFAELVQMDDTRFLSTFFPNKDLFFNIVNSINNMDKNIAIASFGNKLGIFTILDRYWKIMCNQSILTIFNNNTLLGIQDLDGEIKPNIRKNTMIQQLMDYYQIQDKKKVLFIDDNISNITIAKQENYNSLWINNENKNILGIKDTDLISLGLVINQNPEMSNNEVCWFCTYHPGKHRTGLGYLCELCKTKMNVFQMY